MSDGTITPDDEGEGPPWAVGDMLFRVKGIGAETDRPVKVRRPFAVIGRTPEADIVIADRTVSARHAYLHLDARGVHVVDLVSRSGLRINGVAQLVGWLRPGDSLEIAGRRVELLRVRIDGQAFEPPACVDDMLADSPRQGLVGLTLEPRRSGEPPWVIGSELIFLGWSASCGIQIKDADVARTHCVLLRSTHGAYLIDLCGQRTWVEDRPVRGASALRDGDLITIGSTEFTVRITWPAPVVPELLPPPALDAAPTELALYDVRRTLPATIPAPAIDTELIPAEAQTALLAWMMGTVQGSQVEVLRRQGEFQETMTEVLRQIQRDNAALLTAQLERIDGFHREIAALRDEIERRNGREVPPPPLPDVSPLRIARPEAGRDGPASVSQAPTHWLLTRVNQLEEENRSAWRDLLGRLSPTRKPS